MNKPKSKVVCIVGPTSSGKTKLAVKLAKIFNGEIVSADSRQVYKGMDIGTGKDLNEYIIKKSKNQKIKKSIPCHLIDIASPKSQFTLAQYQKLAYQAIDGIIKRGKVPFLVGGTGLYLQAVIDGYQLADVKPDRESRKQLSKKTIKQLQTLARKYGIEMNESDFMNKRRLIRAIEKAKSIRDTRYAIHDTRNPQYNCLILGIKYSKKIINRRIDKRLIHRIAKEGLIAEVKKLRQNGVSWKRLDDFGLEYRYVAKYLKNELTYEEMLKLLSVASHQYAKRQMTWFKKNKNVKWIKDTPAAKKLLKGFLE